MDDADKIKAFLEHHDCFIYREILDITALVSALRDESSKTDFLKIIAGIGDHI